SHFVLQQRCRARIVQALLSRQGIEGGDGVVSRRLAVVLERFEESGNGRLAQIHDTIDPDLTLALIGARQTADGVPAQQRRSLPPQHARAEENEQQQSAGQPFHVPHDLSSCWSAAIERLWSAAMYLSPPLRKEKENAKRAAWSRSSTSVFPLRFRPHK